MGLDTVELVMEFEEEFDIEIPNTAAENMVTVGDVVEFIRLELTRRGCAADANDIFERVRRLSAGKANIDPDEITPTTSFVEDLGLD
jgi:acyl carrier protein